MLGRVRVPLLFVSAANDPIAPSTILDTGAFGGAREASPVLLAATAEGGHSMVWPEGWRCAGAWAPRVLVEWAQAVCAAARGAPAGRIGRAPAEPGLPAGAAAFCASWRVAETRNYEAYLAKLGLSWAARKCILALPSVYTVTYSIVDGVLHGDTDVPGGQHDVFHTDRTVHLAMMGYKLAVRYAWEDGATLVATMQGDQIAGGKPLTVRRWVDATGTLVAEGSCDGVTYTRTYTC